MKSLVLTFTLLFLGGLHSAHAEALTPEELIEGTSSKVLEIINTDADKIRNEPGYVNQIIDEHILPLIDLRSMGKLILGKHWKSASEGQQTQFIGEFKSMLIRTYAKSIADYGDAKIEVLSNNKQQGKFYIVNTELDLGSGAPLNVAYTFRQKDEVWKVIDLSVDGLSLVKNFRSSFNQEINETSLDSLIDRLANTNLEKNTI